jgi:hypothetical protein
MDQQTLSTKEYVREQAVRGFETMWWLIELHVVPCETLVHAPLRSTPNLLLYKALDDRRSRQLTENY